MTAGAAAEQARVVALGAQMTQVMEGWQTAQQEWAAHKAELESERDKASGNSTSTCKCQLIHLLHIIIERKPTQQPHRTAPDRTAR